MAKWKPIPDYEGYYEVSDTGKVRSVYRYKRVLKPMISANGYERVDLFKNKYRKQFSVHRLVAMAFIDNPDNKPFVNHKDENKLNNVVENLEWVTHIENCNYGTAIQRRLAHTDYSKMKRHPENQIKAVSKPIAQYTLSGEFVRRWQSASECARENKWTSSNISKAVKGEHKTAYGFIFRSEERSDDLSRKLSV